MRNFVADIVAVAEKLRALSGQADPPFSIPLIVEVAFPDAVVTGRELPPGVEEIVTVTDDGALIIYRRDLSTAERRFAIAHAVAHLLFDTGELGVRPGEPFDDAMEQRADAFALELLAPALRMARHIILWPSDEPGDRETYLDQVDQIAAVFHIPPGVVDEQIRALERRQNRQAISA